MAQKKSDDGATDTEIKIGNTNPYSGPASAYGTIGKAIDAYFKMVNEQGGVNGRKINFITYDDGYSPPKTVEMVRKLVEQDQVLFVFQTLGTPTNTAIHKYMNGKKVPQLFVATGATKWNDPEELPVDDGLPAELPDRGPDLRAAHPEELPGRQDRHPLSERRLRQGLPQGLPRRAGRMPQSIIVIEQTYEVTDPTVDSQIVNLKNSGANVFFNVTTPKFAVQAIHKAHDIGWKPVHFLNNVSSSLATVLKPGRPRSLQGPHHGAVHEGNHRPAVEERQGLPGLGGVDEEILSRGSDRRPVQRLRVLGAQTMVHVLKQCGNDLRRENVMRQAANLKNFELPLLLPGIKVNTSPTDHAPIEQEQLAKFDGERWVLFGELYDASKK